MNQDLPKIHFWPNLMTAGNLFCGFYAILLLRHQPDAKSISLSISLILIACVFDLFDGRIARAIGEESPFGREFDSLADIVSFGVAPAFLMHEIVLDHLGTASSQTNETLDRFGWFIAFAYILCGAIRLARFNCLATMGEGKPSKNFTGCPIPAAAGVICSITLLLGDFEKRNIELGGWKYCLPVILLLLSFLMVSKVPYPSFKGLSWRTKRTIPWFITAIFMVALTVILPKIMPAVFFLGYLFYGFIRPWVSRQWRREIEDDPDEPDDSEDEEERTA